MINRHRLFTSGLFSHRNYPSGYNIDIWLLRAVGSKEPPCFKVTLVAVLRAKVLGL